MRFDYRKELKKMDFLSCNNFENEDRKKSALLCFRDEIVTSTAKSSSVRSADYLALTSQNYAVLSNNKVLD